jgi:Ca2+-binding EF-hand superfamily protein
VEIPEWFKNRDRDGDGQVMMHEFATHWNDAKVAEFKSYDENDDGIITLLDLGKALRNMASPAGSKATEKTRSSSGN